MADARVSNPGHVATRSKTAGADDMNLSVHGLEGNDEHGTIHVWYRHVGQRHRNFRLMHRGQPRLSA